MIAKAKAASNQSQSLQTKDFQNEARRPIAVSPILCCQPIVPVNASIDFCPRTRFTRGLAMSYENLRFKSLYMSNAFPFSSLLVSPWEDISVSHTFEDIDPHVVSLAWRKFFIAKQHILQLFVLDWFLNLCFHVLIHWNGRITRCK